MNVFVLFLITAALAVPEFVSVTVSDKTATSATLLWSIQDPADVTVLKVEHKEAGKAFVTTKLDTTTTAYSFTGLKPNTKYVSRVFARDAPGADNVVRVQKSYRTLPKKPLFESTAAQEVTSSSAVLLWALKETHARSYDTTTVKLRIKEAGSSNWDLIDTFDYNQDQQTEVGSLLSGQEYVVQLIAKNKGGVTKKKVTFTTPSSPTGRDDFDGSSLDQSWSLLNSDSYTVAVENGLLKVTLSSECALWPYCTWFNEGNQGAFLYKSVTSNFKATSYVRARKQSNPSEATAIGSNTYLFAGIMARDPASNQPSGQENYIFTVVGSRGSQSVNIGHVNEVKSTVNDDSTGIIGFDLPAEAGAGGDAEIRLCRVGNTFYLLIKSDDSWASLHSYDRSDLPSALHIGLVTYNFGSEYDIQGQFDFFQLEDTGISSSADCLTD